MQYIEKHEMYRAVLNKIFISKLPTYAKSKKEKKLKTEETVQQPTYQIPDKLQDAIKYKRDYQNSFPKDYDPDFVEKIWYEYWETNKFYSCSAESAKNSKQEDKFVIILPPPNVTGSLHVGHALTGAIQDCLCRWRRMQGKHVVYVPGIDHAGIATQAVVEKKLLKEGIDKHQIGRKAFVAKVWEWKNQYGNTISKQLRRIASSFDWERFSFTMDDPRSKGVTATFCKLFEQGLIYRAQRLVHWSCSLKTVISDIEVESIELSKATKLTIPGYSEPIEFGVLVDFAYKVENSNDEIIVSTTRLETMLGDTAVAVNSKDPRYQHLIGKNLVHPFVKNRKIKIIQDDLLVDMSFGTGAVKVTPAHDANDLACGLRNGLEMINIFTDTGELNENGGKYVGKKRYNVRRVMEEDLKLLGLFRGKKDNKMILGICSRSKDVIEPLLKPQWYVNCQTIKQKMKEIIINKELILVPENHEKIWNHWMDNLQDWCISRQLWWGHQIPVYEIVLENGQIIKDDKGETIWVVGRSQEEAIKNAQKYVKSDQKYSIKQDEDVLDTWFSSALLPFTNFGWPDESLDLSTFYPNTILETGSDILFFWVIRMVTMGILITGQVPFKTVYLHNIVRDENGEKMSKSKGNVIDPLEIIEGATLDVILKKIKESYLPDTEKNKSIENKTHKLPNGIPKCGSDSLRFSLLRMVSESKDINLDIQLFIINRNFCTKIWNSYKMVRILLAEDFDLKQIDDFKIQKTSVLSQADLWILNKLNNCVKIINNAFEEYKFSVATEAFKLFWVEEFSSFYLEYSKTVDKTNQKIVDSNKRVLFHCLETMLRLLHPMMPFLTEELYQKLPQFEGKKESISLSLYPKFDESFCSEKSKIFENVFELVNTLRKLRSTIELPANCRPPVYMAFENESKKEIIECVLQYKEFIKYLTKCDDQKFVTVQEIPEGCLKGLVHSDFIAAIYLKDSVKASEEIGKINTEIKRIQAFIQKYEKKLTDSEYEKAPENIKLREKESNDANVLRIKQLTESKEQFEKLKQD